jgi:CTP synthase
VSSQPTKYIFVTGGVLSGLGKGITAASIGALLKARGLKVNIQKCDPYLNVDAGLLNPREHGECFVTHDGAETDLDLGHYERFIDEELTKSSSLMSGRVLLNVINDERLGKYEGKTVQIIPHVTNAIQDRILKASEGFDVHIVEIGGTVGDYESQSFIEAIREFGLRVGRDNAMYVHVVYLPYLGASKETKTKPAQNSVRDIRGLGISPDVLVARSEAEPANGNIIEKLALFCGVEQNAIVLLPNAATIYNVPLTLAEHNIDSVITNRLALQVQKPDLSGWEEVVQRATTKWEKTVHVGVVAKYMDNEDTYMSVFEALHAAAWWQNANIDLKWIDAEKLESSDVAAALQGLDGIVVPGGFGTRAIEGKIKAATHALDAKLPYLGLCLGMQVSVIAAARRAGLSDANSTEFNPGTKNPVITHMEGQEGKESTGGTMRLGNYNCTLTADSKAAESYGQTEIIERHRHRFEANGSYIDTYQSWGIAASGINPDNGLVEVIEALEHPFFVASQFHPEFKSRPGRPHPLFAGFVKSLIA